MTTDRSLSRRIVVGVDGSSSSMRALAWASRAAESMDAELVAVYAYPAPLDPFTRGYGRETQQEFPLLRQDAEDRLGDAIAGTLDAEHAAVVSQIVQGGLAEDALINTATAQKHLSSVATATHGSRTSSWARSPKT